MSSSHIRRTTRRPNQTHLGVAGRAVNGLRGFGELVGLALIVLGDVGRGRGRRLAGLVLGLGIAALGGGGADTDQQCKPGGGEVTQNRISKLEHPSTHKFPD